MPQEIDHASNAPPDATLTPEGDASGCTDDAADRILAGLYNMAAMLVGDGEDGAMLVETAVASSDVQSCQDEARIQYNSGRALCRAAIALIAERDPASLAAPVDVKPLTTCIHRDELEAAGITRAELESIITGPDRERVRKWLESLSIPVRTIFVLHAVAGYTAAESAFALSTYGGPQAAGWNPNAVGELFRLGLCSLASQLLHSSTSRSQSSKN
jgi:hypothetical protein